MSSVSAEQMELAREICRPNLVKKLMRENKLAHSFGLRVAFSTEMPLVAKRAGYSAVLMNLEHMAIGMETMKDIAVSCLNVGLVDNLSKLHGIPPLANECAALHPWWLSQLVPPSGSLVVWTLEHRQLLYHMSTTQSRLKCV